MAVKDMQELHLAWQERQKPSLDQEWISTGSNQLAIEEIIESMQSQLGKWRDRQDLPSLRELSRWLRGLESHAYQWSPEEYEHTEAFTKAEHFPEYLSSAVTDTFPKKPERLDLEIPQQQVKDFWNDAWKDKNGDKWQVAATSIDEYERHPSHRCYGQILCNGERVGDFTRVLTVMPNGKLIAKHDYCTMDKKTRGKGFAKTWLSRCAERYQAWDVQKATLETAWSGAYTWPRLGFDIDKPKDRDRKGNPSDYLNSAYADEMRELLKPVEENLDWRVQHNKISQDAGEKLMTFTRKLYASEDGPISLPELIREYPDFCKKFLYDASMYLSASTEALLRLRGPNLERMESMAASKAGPQLPGQLSFDF